MIFLAVARPIPGTASSSLSLAVFRSTAVAGADFPFLPVEVWLDEPALSAAAFFCGAAETTVANASAAVNTARDRLTSGPPANERMIDDQHNNCANHRNEDAVQVYSAYPMSAEHAEKPSAYHCPDDSENDVEENSLSGVIDDLASDEARDQSQNDPCQKRHCL